MKLDEDDRRYENHEDDSEKCDDDRTINVSSSPCGAESEFLDETYTTPFHESVQERSNAEDSDDKKWNAEDREDDDNHSPNSRDGLGQREAYNIVSSI